MRVTWAVLVSWRASQRGSSAGLDSADSLPSKRTINLRLCREPLAEFLSDHRSVAVKEPRSCFCMSRAKDLCAPRFHTLVSVSPTFLCAFYFHFMSFPLNSLMPSQQRCYQPIFSCKAENERKWLAGRRAVVTFRFQIKIPAAAQVTVGTRAADSECFILPPETTVFTPSLRHESTQTFHLCSEIWGSSGCLHFYPLKVQFVRFSHKCDWNDSAADTAG